MLDNFLRYIERESSFCIIFSIIIIGHEGYHLFDSLQSLKDNASITMDE